MYLGKVSLTRLKMLLMGYGMSRGELGLQLTQEEKQFAFNNGYKENIKLSLLKVGKVLFCLK